MIYLRQRYFDTHIPARKPYNPEVYLNEAFAYGIIRSCNNLDLKL